jgi:hypothetical protein
MVRFDTVRRSRFGALWDGILRFVGFGYGGSGTIRLGWVWLRAVRFDMAVKLGSGWAAFGQAGRVTFRYGGLRQGGLGSIRSVWARHVAVRYVTAVKVIQVELC